MNPEQVTTAILFAFLSCHAIMKQHNDANFSSNANIYSENVKFLVHNVQFEVVTKLEKRIIELEDGVKSAKKDYSVKSKKF